MMVLAAAMAAMVSAVAAMAAMAAMAAIAAAQRLPAMGAMAAYGCALKHRRSRRCRCSRSLSLFGRRPDHVAYRVLHRACAALASARGASGGSRQRQQVQQAAMFLSACETSRPEHLARSLYHGLARERLRGAVLGVCGRAELKKDKHRARTRAVSR